MAACALPVPPLRSDSDASCPASVYRFNYVWTVHNFRFCGTIMGDYVLSPHFSPEEDQQMQWRMKLCPNGFTESNKGYLSVYAILAEYNGPEVFARVKFSLLNNRREEVNTMDDKQTRTFIRGKSYCVEKFIRRDIVLSQFSNILHGDKLVLWCEMIVIYCQNSFTHLEIRSEPPEKQLVHDLRQLFDTKKFCDVTLVVGDQEIMAHQAILGGRSPVLCAMLQIGWKKGEKKRIHINGMRANILEKVCRFMYTGQIQGVESFDSEILEAADRFCLPALKQICEESLRAKITLQNATKYLILATKFRLPDLKSHAMHFIRENVTEVKKTAGWRTLSRLHPSLLIEILWQPASTSKSSPALETTI
ncbi:speckle-type POZ protein-like [Ischnura elegans]|uniref:speckle-type POZ protein-like n=1 Tax=Ischnura elegans TaxID=197161 RepID=UPI001ED8B123|nr:speckle-type POZ protein-like [Ischnura elegans]